MLQTLPYVVSVLLVIALARWVLLVPESSIFGYQHLTTQSSIQWVAFVGAGLLLATGVYLIRFVLAQRLVRSAVTPKQGEAILSGVARFARGTSHAMTLEVIQAGETFSPTDDPHTRWEEVSRTQRFDPFYVECASGERIRVEPSQHTLFVDALAMRGDDALKPSERKGVATLEDGEPVWVRGRMERSMDPEQGEGYRGGGAAALVFRCAARSPLRVSTIPLDVEARNVVKHQKEAAFVFAVLTLAFFAITAAPFVDRLYGTTTVGEIVSCRASFEGKANKPAGFTMEAADEKGRIEERMRTCLALKTPMPIRRGRVSSQLGPYATVSGRTLVYWLLLAVGAFTLVVFAKAKDAAWHRHKKLSSYEDGTLEQTKNTHLGGGESPPSA